MVTKGMGETLGCFWDVSLSTCISPDPKFRCACAWLAGAWQGLQRSLGRTTACSSHLTSHLQLWVGHRVPKVWLILVNIDEAGICGAVKYHLRYTEKHCPCQTPHKAPPYSSSQAEPTITTLAPLSPPCFSPLALGFTKIAEKWLQEIGV